MTAVSKPKRRPPSAATTVLFNKEEESGIEGVRDSVPHSSRQTQAYRPEAGPAAAGAAIPLIDEFPNTMCVSPCEVEYVSSEKTSEQGAVAGIVSVCCTEATTSARVPVAPRPPKGSDV